MAPRVDCRLSVTSVMVALAIVAIPLPVLGAAPEATPGPAVQVPEAERAAPPSEAAPPVQRSGPPAETVPPPTDATRPAEPAPGATTATPTDAVPEAAPVDAVPADALEAAPATTKPAPSRSVTTTQAPANPESQLSPAEEIAREYGPRYRPRENPGRFNLVVRGLFANVGGSKIVGGRLGGVAADFGQSWNHFGYALTGTVYGGRVALEDKSGVEMNALIGVGPTVGLGRLALLGRGFLDVRLGYDFYYAVVNQRDDVTISSGNDPGDVTIIKAKNLVPHGPRVRLDLGLLSLSRNKFFHGFGVSMGYQALVGSMNGGMPPAHMLTLGLSYWMG